MQKTSCPLGSPFIHRGPYGRETWGTSWAILCRCRQNLFRISFQQFLNSDIGLSVAVWIDRSFSRSWSLARSRLTRRKEHKRWRERQRATCYKASLKRKQLDIRKPDLALLLRVNNPTRALLAPNLRSFPQAFHIHSAFTRIHRASYLSNNQLPVATKGRRYSLSPQEP